MFHTVLLFQSIHALDYPILKSILCKISNEQKCRHYPDEDFPDLYIFNLYSNHGITLLLRRTRLKSKALPNNGDGQTSSDIYYHAIEIRLNPKVLIEEREYVMVAKQEDFSLIRDKFKQILKPLQKRMGTSPMCNNYRLNAIEEYQVKRIDYCINIRSMLHEKYMELIRRADIPANFYLVTELDKKSGRRVAYKNSFYLQTKKHSVGVNIYNKESQMKNNFKSYERLEDADHIIRIEVQCLNGKTNNMKQKHGWRYRDFSYFVNEEIARDTIYSYYEKTVGFEDYYTLDEAKRRIKGNKQYKYKTIAKMIEILELVNQKRSIYKARLAYSDEMTNHKDVEEFNSIIKKIKKCGINPVTIPVNWGYNYIPNLVEKMDKEFTQPLRVVIS